MTQITFTNTNNFVIRDDDCIYIDDSKQLERSYKRQALQIVGKDLSTTGKKYLRVLLTTVINVTDEWIKSV